MYIGKEPAAEWPAFVASARIAAMTRRVISLAHRSRVQIAVADNCTGGLLASLLTDVSSHGAAFEGSSIATPSTAQYKALGAPPAPSIGGPASGSAARLMVQAVLAESGADIALSIIGWAEPRPYAQEPVGTVWFGCGRRGGSISTRRACFGDIGSELVRRGCLGVALEMALDDLQRRQ